MLFLFIIIIFFFILDLEIVRIFIINMLIINRDYEENFGN